MKITALAENISNGELKAVHGLSFYVRTKKHRLLFDIGPDNSLFENAKRKKIDLSKVDTVIISHGHKDHGGALKRFMQINKTARIYIQKKAFEPHYVKVLLFKVFIGLDRTLMNDKRVVLLDADHRIDDELEIFTAKGMDSFKSSANSNLYTKDGRDDFSHEQDLIIHENEDVLFMGCGHSGVINILKSASDTRPAYCIGGFHVFDPVSRRTIPEDQLAALSKAFDEYKDIKFYTCHCTGRKAYGYLKSRHPNISYFHCGDQLVI